MAAPKKKKSIKAITAGPIDLSEVFTVAGASVVTGLSVADVNKHMDRDLDAPELVAFGLVRIGSGVRYVTARGLRALRIVADMMELSIEARRELVRRAMLTPKETTFNLGNGNIAVCLESSTNTITNGLAALQRATIAVCVDAAILSGEPCLAGTRTSVYTIAALFEAGGADDVKDAYDWISDAEIEAAAIYAKANPRRGRPPRSAGGVLSKSGSSRSTTRTIVME